MNQEGQHKHIAYVAARDIAFTQVISQGMPDTARYHITRAVPKRIIELLKAIQIEHYNTKWSIPSLNLVAVSGQTLLQIAAVV